MLVTARVDEVETVESDEDEGDDDEGEQGTLRITATRDDDSVTIERLVDVEDCMVDDIEPVFDAIFGDEETLVLEL